jgi:hypothetical protein
MVAFFLQGLFWPVLAWDVPGREPPASDFKRVAVTAEGKNLPAADQATLLLLQPRRFCAGVIRAIEVVELALQKLGWPVFVRVEQVVNRAKSWGFPQHRGSGMDPRRHPIYFAAELTS